MLAPILMRPAYRFGPDTPWGGDGLKALFGKPIPDPRTGEALELSAIPGLESVSPDGEALPALVARYGERLTGPFGGGAFPLLLKLISARDDLSVQVHPGDGYARERYGKLGKSEAWVILHAEKGASIRYGLVPGATTDGLRRALDAGEDVSPLIRRVPVAPGDVFYIPSGLVHAIGGGVTLYEIQQSSDLTFRLWDYDRADANGCKRALHLREAMDVLDPALTGERAALPASGQPGLYPLLRVPAFDLDFFVLDGALALPPRPDAFRALTALDALRLTWAEGALDLAPGQTALLPAECPELRLTGAGRGLVASSCQQSAISG